MKYFTLLSKSSMSLAVWVSIILLKSTLIENAAAAKILFFHGLSSHSHRVAVQPLATKMADLGHQVTFFSPIKPEVPNTKISEYCPKAVQQLNDYAVKYAGEGTNRLFDKNFDPFEGNFYWDILNRAVEITLGSQEFLEWLSASKFDLIIHDHPGKEYIYAYAHHTGAKVIAFVPISTARSSDFDIFGYSIESWFTGFHGNNWWYIPDRVFNAFNSVSQHLTYKNYYLPKVEALARKAFNFDFPPLFELLQRNTDLVFLNDHFSTAFSRPLPPNIISVGGMHVTESNGTLPEELEIFLQDVNKFIYISFGSVIKVSMLPKEIQQYFFDAVNSFSQIKFLWKWEGEMPENFPKNAVARKWFPQQDVLAHAKCGGFMTQGGQMSMQQAVYHGVPVIVVPAFGDQHNSARTAAQKNFGIHLDIMSINKETLINAFNSVINEAKYTKTAKALSLQFRDRPMTAVDTAVWWIEYVLRHDTSHLKSGGHYLTWYERRCLDVWLGVVLVTVAFLFILRKVVKFLMCRHKPLKEKSN